MTNTVANELVGAVWPSVQPGTDPVLYGHVLLDPLGAFEARIGTDSAREKFFQMTVPESGIVK